MRKTKCRLSACFIHSFNKHSSSSNSAPDTPAVAPYATVHKIFEVSAHEEVILCWERQKNNQISTEHEVRQSEALGEKAKPDKETDPGGSRCFRKGVS